MDWRSDDGRSSVLCGDVLERMEDIASESIQCCVTSPPYYGLRNYGADGQIGLEPSPEAYVEKMVQVFRGVRRVLRKNGTLWLNLGDSYLAGKQLGGIPWRVAFALQADGWILRQDIIWCLSGGTWLYVKTEDSGICLSTIKDLARLDPQTVKLWNGSKWTQLLGMGKTRRSGSALEIVLRSGERISCTATHQFPTDRGLLRADEIRAGDVLASCSLPPPELPRDCAIDCDAAWFAGLYIAEGSRSGDKIQISGHSKESARWVRVKAIAEKFGGSATMTQDGNNQTIRVFGKVLLSIVDELVTGKTSKNKGFSPSVWRYSNSFISAMLDGYLSGDGHWDEKNLRWRLGFTRNYSLERDLRTACARLGYKITLKLSSTKFQGKSWPTFRGELRVIFDQSHHNSKPQTQVVEIRKARCREVYDLAVEDEPHLFALASGVLTHNCKPSPMPSSVTDRCTTAHEFIFLLAKSERYYYDAEAIKEESIDKESLNGRRPRKTRKDHTDEGQASLKTKFTARGGFLNGKANDAGRLYLTRNRRSVWKVSTKPYKGAHFATFPPDLIEPCILAGTSAEGCCSNCRAPLVRQTSKTKLKRSRPNAYTKRTHEEGTGNACANDVAGVAVETLGWAPSCDCAAEVIPCAVLDPFAGSGTTLQVARHHGRNGVGIELNPDYIELAKARIMQPLKVKKGKQ